eukprot:TRINITY_DN9451_c0_g1_i7.p1 TRINITY_DN9451_c0_g1~~TRINITY_DN9451_c0_g1_i7.p1  ORF type:complete len:108 (-),score=3.32 TRINITY_DN9451_c0_g1_i7:47-370(-)
MHGNSKEEAWKQASFIRDTLTQLGFILNWDKCSTKPMHRMEALGFIVDSRNLTLQLPKEKLRCIRSTAKAISRGPVSGRALASFLGQISAAAQAILPSRLRTRALMT